MDNALSIIQQWISESNKKISVIPRSDRLFPCHEALGITERSVLGTLFNHTGGLSVADGLIRHFGGTNRFNLSIVEANEIIDKKPKLIEDALIVAIDLYNGLFGINIKYLGAKPGSMVYLPPESYSWYPMKIGHSDFVQWSMSDKVEVFYKDYQQLPILSNLAFDMIAQYMPPLWSADISSNDFHLSTITVKKMLAIRAGYLTEINNQFS